MQKLKSLPAASGSPKSAAVVASAAIHFHLTVSRFTAATSLTETTDFRDGAVRQSSRGVGVHLPASSGGTSGSTQRTAVYSFVWLPCSGMNGNVLVPPARIHPAGW